MRQTIASNRTVAVIAIVAFVGAAYYFANPNPQFFYDYTFRVADNLVRGAIGIGERPPSWLNEFIPFEGQWYSAFSFGSVLSMVPFAFLKLIGLVEFMPAAAIAAILGATSFVFLMMIAREYDLAFSKQLLVSLGIVLGSWMWTNIAMAGAWQLALGWAVIGELGAIYFTVFSRRPLIAGLFFALAFGNRTEILLTAPVFMYLLARGRKAINEGRSGSLVEPRAIVADLAYFCAIPFVLGFATLIYNQIRFDSFLDFGYSRIPGVLDEPWYRYGIFSLRYIPQNAIEMLYTPWRRVSDFPFLIPSGFGVAIWWSSPFLFLLFRRGVRDRMVRNCAWGAIAVLTFLLWTHGNTGGWQFAYRYTMVLLPWIFVLLLENGPKKLSPLEIAVFGLSIVINAWATYLFFWTDFVRS